MALIEKETIRAEIERLIQIARYQWRPQSEQLCQELLDFLDTLQEQPVVKKSNALFDECVENCDPAVMKEVSDNVDKMLGRQPVEGLEEEITRYTEEKYHETFGNGQGTLDEFDWEDITWVIEDTAKHFAEWGATHLK